MPWLLPLRKAATKTESTQERMMSISSAKPFFAKSSRVMSRNTSKQAANALSVDGRNPSPHLKIPITSVRFKSQAVPKNDCIGP